MRRVGDKSLRGMTLVELLAVIVIIGILAALLLPAIQRARNKALVVRAQTEARELVKAWNGYWLTYTNLPASLTSAAVEMTADMVKILNGTDTANNPSKIAFTAFPPGAEVEGFLDPWGKPYLVRLHQQGEVENTWSFAARAWCAHRKRYDDEN